MSTKHFTRILLAILCLVLSFAICSCTQIEEIQKEAERVIAFAEQIATVVETQDLEKAKELIHPDSKITEEYIKEKLENNEKLNSIDVENLTIEDVSIASIGEPKMVMNDPNLGGNVYELEAQVMIGDTPVEIVIILLSNDAGMGFYDFDIK